MRTVLLALCLASLACSSSPASDDDAGSVDVPPCVKEELRTSDGGLACVDCNDAATACVGPKVCRACF